MPGPGLPLLRDRRSAVLVITVLLVVVALLRTRFDDPADAVGVLACVPITLAAVRFGPWAGAFTGLVALAMFIGLAVVTGAELHYGLLSLLPRFVAVVFLGLLVGMFARARMELDVRSRLLFDLSPDLMGTVDAEGRLLDRNEAWRRLAEQLDGVEPLAPEGALALLGEDAVAMFEQEVPRRDGVRQTIEWHVRRDPRYALRYIVGRDVTGRNERADYVRELLATSSDQVADEHQAVAGELHDEVLQTLLVALMHLEAGADPADVSANADAADVHVRDAIAALRRVMDDIQPLELEHLDDAAALELAATRVEEAWDVHVDRHIDVTSVLSPEHRLLAYRVAHEALSVSVKLAHASSISLSAQDIDGGFELCVADDGRGLGRRIDIEDAHVPEFGTGLNLLLEQVIAAGGRCAVSSAPDTGTAMSITLPVVRPAAPVAPLKRG